MIHTILLAGAFPNPLAWTWADTKGANLSWVPIVFTPVSYPLFPGAPPQPSAWSEFRYTAYCYRLPTP